MNTISIIGISITIYLAIGICWAYHFISVIFYPNLEKQNEVKNLIETRNELEDTIEEHGKIKPMIIMILIFSVQWLPINIFILFKLIIRRIGESKQ